MKRIALSALLCATALPAWAGEAWESIRTQLYGDRMLLSGEDMIALDAPYRTDDDARTRIAAMVQAPSGLQLGRVTLLLDENPMPVSADFALDRPQPAFFFDVTLRINGPTALHVIAETTDGRLWFTEGYVKTSGQGACAAPPGTDPELALATLGEMDLQVERLLPGAMALGPALTARLQRLDVDISHPSHSGMQRDQITLLYIPMRYVGTLQIGMDGQAYATMAGSISLSENPGVGLSVPSSARST